MPLRRFSPPLVLILHGLLDQIHSLESLLCLFACFLSCPPPIFAASVKFYVVSYRRPFVIFVWTSRVILFSILRISAFIYLICCFFFLYLPVLSISPLVFILLPHFHFRRPLSLRVVDSPPLSFPFLISTNQDLCGHLPPTISFSPSPSPYNPLQSGPSTSSFSISIPQDPLFLFNFWIRTRIVLSCVAWLYNYQFHDFVKFVFLSYRVPILPCSSLFVSFRFLDWTLTLRLVPFAFLVGRSSNPSFVVSNLDLVESNIHSSHCFTFSGHFNYPALLSCLSLPHQAQC